MAKKKSAKQKEAEKELTKKLEALKRHELVRSEERRVGKECRYRWEQKH